MKYAVLAVTICHGLALAHIDSGGGKSAVGTMTNHSSIGASFASATYQMGPITNHSGLIEVLYATGVPTDPDANANGLPDDWEQEFFQGQTVDPDADQDGDGTSNRMEYIAGTNPTDRSSVFKPTGTFSEGLYRLPMQTVAGRTYKVYATKNLTSWHLQQTIQGDGTIKTFVFDETAIPSGPLHSSVHPSSYFFRVEVTLP